MKAEINHEGSKYSIDFSKPLDISIPLRGDAQNVNTWYLGHPRIEPHEEADFVGKVSLGSSVNFNDIWFNPHAHGTHTECVGHITEEFYSVNQHLNRFFFLAELVTVVPELQGDDWVISKHILEVVLPKKEIQALVIRTSPNDRDKLSRQYSNTNPPYLLEDAVDYILSKGVEHLLIDLPSVDKEKDDGALKAHKAFWNYHGQLRKQATITEFIYVPDAIEDGPYFLNLQMAPFENDASPSRPVLYEIQDV
ncbi:cyclase family protein [Euzebyella marina]|uniref:Cyclase family protein n=1 Tax=Euzebyella marina TaxID=1761453 RepID=A0A3G2L2G5_9FLAO|nr:cyclase family protein [Euzebyella marina]AYN66438.1 cyclase family protein [Euzebyella marina]